MFALKLQTQKFKVIQEKELCIIINTRELNGVLSTIYLSLYTTQDSLCYYYT